MDWPLELNFDLVWVDVFDTLQGRPFLFWLDIPLAEIGNKWLFLSIFGDYSFLGELLLLCVDILLLFSL